VSSSPIDPRLDAWRTFLRAHAQVTRLIDRLERDGLVERISCESDRRGQWASLTDAGERRLRDASPTHLRGVTEHFLDRIPADELERLRRSLERLNG
jgi:DNA-binding MarR family transcriptional regulator